MAIVRVNMMMAALAAPMTASPGVAVLPASEATFTMAPNICLDVCTDMRVEFGIERRSGVNTLASV
jgi:hypothetical protein